MKLAGAILAVLLLSVPVAGVLTVLTWRFWGLV